jgi:hypothetical protein
MSGFKGIASNRGPQANSSDLLTQMKERKALEQDSGSSSPNVQTSCKQFKKENMCLVSCSKLSLLQ